MPLRALPLLFAALFSAAEERGNTDRGRRHLEPGRTYTAWFYAAETGRLWPLFSQELQAIVGSESGLRTLRDQLVTQAGQETAVLREWEFRLPPLFEYVRRASFSLSARNWEIHWVYDGEGRIGGFNVEPERTPAASRFLDYETKTPLSLPFSGDWLIFWGGRSVVENYHAEYSDQRFAYDVLALGEEGFFLGEGANNLDYPCFGQPILAPGDGTVVEAVDGVADNVPGITGSGHAGGNRIVLNHGNGEFSFLAHFQQGSVLVRAGQTVSAGEEIGRCGNSGNSTLPHLHYHLQNSPTWFAGEGLPILFRDYVADGELVESGEPRRGQIVTGRETSVSPGIRPPILPSPRVFGPRKTTRP